MGNASFLLSAGLALLLVGCAAEDARSVAASAGDVGERAVAGEYIVTAAPSVDVSGVREVYRRYAIGKLEDLGRGRFLVQLAEDPGLDQARRIGLASGKVTAVEPNLVYRYQ